MRLDALLAGGYVDGMPAYAALLRAINVGGTGKLLMKDLRQLCEDEGFTCVGTYIQSGNVVFRSPRTEPGVKKRLETALAAKLGKPCGVLVRKAEELRALLAENPFPSAAPSRLLILFLDEEPSPSSLAGIPAPGGEQLRASGRQVFIHFPNGQARSQLKLPFSRTATGRNLNTVRKLLQMLEELG